MKKTSAIPVVFILGFVLIPIIFIGSLVISQITGYDEVLFAIPISFGVYFVVIFLTVMITIITAGKNQAKHARNNTSSIKYRPSNSHESQVNYSKNYSLKENSSIFGNSINSNKFINIDESHGDQYSYQMKYSKANALNAQERAQLRREAIELETIKDKPLSEAERNVLFGN